MKLLVDSNNFVRLVTTIDSDVEVPVGYYIVLIPGLVLENDVLDIAYGLPNYKYINNTVLFIIDPLDYVVDSELWNCYFQKAKQQVRQLLQTKTIEEMRDIYNSAPSYMQDIIYNEIEYVGADKFPQNSINLLVETFVKAAIGEYLYIKLVENREPNEEELAVIKELLTKFHNHASLYLPLAMNKWYIMYTEYALSNIDALRSETLPLRYAITGRI